MHQPITLRRWQFGKHVGEVFTAGTNTMAPEYSRQIEHHARPTQRSYKPWEGG
jgi:hypothetical protein